MVAFAFSLYQWYRKNHIRYPWRTTSDPYNVWLSEILLQQTRIPVALKFYEKILRKYPDLQSLAKAHDEDFLSLWSGIGYYRRAHHMLECAREIMRTHGGVFPGNPSALLSLPGIGKYTSGAIRNICFNHLTPAIDSNIRRVLSRITMSTSDLETRFLKFGAGLPAGDFFQSLMELGERICLPEPLCLQCPVARHCKAKGAGKQNQFPESITKKPTKIVHWYLLMLKSGNAHYYLQNPSRAFLKHAWIFPDVLSNHRLPAALLKREFEQRCGIHVSSLTEKKIVKHSVTFRKIHAHVLEASSFRLNGSPGKWMDQDELEKQPTSSITAKVLTAMHRERLARSVQTQP